MIGYAPKQNCEKVVYMYMYLYGHHNNMGIFFSLFGENYLICTIQTCHIAIMIKQSVNFL